MSITEKIDIKSMLPSEIEDFIIKTGHPKFRAKQIFSWISKGITEFSEMRNLPKDFILQMEELCEIKNAKIIKVYRSNLDSTCKYLVKFNGGEYGECVLLKYNHGYSICISSQIGCKMGCAFCVTGQGGFSRNLTASEMLSQIMAVQREADVRISNVVLMGMGEPLDNFDNVMRFLELVSHPEGLCIGQRHITVSSCGIVDKIEELIGKKPQFTLSISLHAPNNEKRKETMPIAKKWSITELIDVCRRYTKETGRRISFEYALIKGKNDSDGDADELAKLLYGMICHVNLIPVNQSGDKSFQKPGGDSVKRFCERLNSRGVNATVRRTLGADIDASCGQLRQKHQEQQ